MYLCILMDLVVIVFKISVVLLQEKPVRGTLCASLNDITGH